MDSTLFNLLNAVDPIGMQEELAKQERDGILGVLNAQQARKDAIDKSCEEDFTPLGGELHNPTKANSTILHETPRHRHIVLLSVRGFTHTEIAEMTGMSITWISQIVRQPWARKMQLKLMTEGHTKAVEILVAAAPEAYQTIVDIMRDPEAPKNVRLKACTEIRDTVDGKPAQELKIESKSHITYGTPEEIDEELQRINAEIAHAMGKN